MEYINTKRSHSLNSIYSLLFLVFVIVIAVYLTVSLEVEALFGLIILFILPFLFSLDIFLWHSIGKEIIYTQDKKLIIKGKNRVFPIKKKICFEKIEDIYLWESKGFFKDIFLRRVPFYKGSQGKITIKYDNGCEYHIGRYLNEVEAEELLKILKSEISCTPAKSSPKTKIVGIVLWIILISIILYIIIGLTIGY